MNIGIVSTWFSRGAAYVTKQYEAALQRDHRVFIYARGDGTSADDPAWNTPNVTFGAEPVYPGASAVDLDDFDRWIRRERLDLVIFNEQWWWAPVVHCARRGIRTAAYLVEYQCGAIPLYQLYDILFAHTRQHFDTFPNHPSRHYLPWGTTLASDREPSFEPVNPGRTTFFHSAGMNPNRKGTDLLLAAYKRALDQGLDADLVLHFQRPWRSYSWDYPKGAELMADLERLPTVRLVERNFADPRDAYALGDVCVYPARFDGLGLTLAEAGVVGLPVIAPDHAPWNEFVSERNGSVVPCARTYMTPRSCHPYVEIDGAGLSEALLAWSRRDIPSARAEALSFARERFDWMKNAAPMSAIAERSQLLPGKEELIRQTEEYERKRRRSLRQKISFSAPTAVKYARSVYRLFARS